MKKFITGILLITVLFLTGCTTTGTIPENGEVISISSIDSYLNSNSRFIDLRNYSDQLKNGYITGFELIPFFQYLEGRALIRNNRWNFTPEDIESKEILENIFGNKNKTIFLMCGSGTRAKYVKAALEEIGYKKVFNIGGIKDYKGKNLIEGDDSFRLIIK
ncbi:MAG: rhodanese-like domain-containing protein [Spirochaetales bacterium]|nr:rhodanese-like domain-containing protein [Spirochaetales bacterium]